MKSNIYKSLLILVCTGLIILMPSCKEGDRAPVPISNTDLLTASAWNYAAMTLSPGVDIGNGQIITDLLPFLDPCMVDNQLKFNSDMTGAISEGATKCDPMAADSEPFVWSFGTDETTLIVNGNESTLKTLTEDLLEIVSVEEDDGEISTLTVRFSH